MAFKLDSVVPWGRNYEEYRLMFQLDDNDMTKRIAGFGDGPASFNFEASKQGCSVKSFDPIYQFTREQIQQRINEVRHTVIQQVDENRDNYVWTTIKDVQALERIRMSAMELFLLDYEDGQKENRYIYHELPEALPYQKDAFDIGLSSHFLLLYPDLGYEFHIKAINEMLRICRQVRIFPIVDLDANKTALTEAVLAYLKQTYTVELRKTNYEFQKGDNQLLIIHNQ